MIDSALILALGAAAAHSMSAKRTSRPRVAALVAVSIAAALLLWLGQSEKGRVLVSALGALVPSAAQVHAGPRADEGFDREGHELVTGGVVYAPPSFRSGDGRFDLLLHFHGNPELVEESAAAVKLDALVYVVNVGDGARAYRDYAYADDICDTLLNRATEAAEGRGLREPRVRRLALSAWSAGYAAVGRLLETCGDRVDAVLLADALHAPYLNPFKHEVDHESLEPFLRFARRAAASERLFVLTHSQLETLVYASAAESADHLLGALGVAREDAKGSSPAPVALAAAQRAAMPGHESALVAVSKARRGDFIVMGFEGDRASNHMDQLIQMSATLLPSLAERWRRQP